MFAILLLFPLLALAGLSPIEVRGNAFFAEGSDTRFYIRGVDYQPGGSSKLFDPLSSTQACERDIKYFKELGVNTIRVYSIDNTADHDECMQLLDDAGIYLIVDTNIPKASIARDSGANCSYNTMYLNEVLATVKLMSKYDNTLGFFAANEVINNPTTTPAATYVKAVIRDIKTFQRNTGLRLIPVGYSAADVEQNRYASAQFFNCGDDPLARVDMYGFNDYSWCGQSSFKVSGYDKKVEAYSNYSVPLFFSEYGCNEVQPRIFSEVEVIYSSQMSSVFSGGLVYEYSEESNNYGLVKIASDNETVTTLTDFTNLKNQFAAVSDPSGDGDYQTDLPYSDCPAASTQWEASNNIPSTPKGALKYLKGTVDPEGNGFDANTQWACVAGGNNVDDSDVVSSKSSSTTGSSTATSGSSSDSSASSTSRLNVAEDLLVPTGALGLLTAIYALLF